MLMATIIQAAGFPILCVPLILIPSSAKSSDPPDPLTKKYIIVVYISLGVLLAGDNLLHAVGLLYLSASTYSLICSTQLAFNAMFALILNSQKITPIILNSIIILSFSAALVAVNQDPDAPSEVSQLEYAIGVLCTLSASAVYGLYLSLMQLAFQKVIKTETFAVVMKMQLYTSIVATVVSTGGLFATGQWKYLEREMKNFNTGPASYIMTLVWAAIAWQVCSVSVVGLVFLVSSLFSNAIVTVALAIAPIASLIVFHDKLSAVKAIAILQALWGFSTYLYENYIDDCRMRAQTQKKKQTQNQEEQTQIHTWRLPLPTKEAGKGESPKDFHCVVSIEEPKQ